MGVFESFKDERDRNAELEMIPMGFGRLSYHVGIADSTYYLIGGYTGSGKTSLLDDAFVLNPYDWWSKNKHTTKLKLKIFYYSMERKRSFKIAKWVARRIFLDEGIVIPVKRMLNRVGQNSKLTPEEIALIDKYEDYIDTMFQDVVTFVDGPQNPMGIKKTIDKYANENGTFKQIDEHNRKYIPNNPNEVVLIIYDHIGLQKKESRKGNDGEKILLHTKKAIIDQSSEDARKFRDHYGYSIVKVSQFNRDISNPLRIKNGDVEPMLEDFKESGNTQEDADVVITLFDPMRYKVADTQGYDMEKLRPNGEKRYRSLKVLKNSLGSDDIGIGLSFQPVVGLFKEMPIKKEITDDDYKAICDNTYFFDK